MISNFNAVLQGIIVEGKEIEFSLVHTPFEVPGQPQVVLLVSWREA